MFKVKKSRDLIFATHRYLGLVLGVLIAVAGLTGSVMIVLSDTKELITIRQIESINPEVARLSLDTLVELAQVAYQKQEKSPIEQIKISPTMFPNHALQSPTLVTFTSGEKERSIMVNPYTGKILGEAPKESFYKAILHLHTNLLAGAVGTTIVGITGLFGSILVVTGIALWPGWRKLSAGFKIKWNAHQKRLNFDLHKLAGVLSSIFLLMTLFTGFMFNFGDWTTPALYAMTFSQKPEYPPSKPILGQASLSIDLLLQKAEAAMPGGKIDSIEVPTKPAGTFDVSKKFPGDISWPRYVMLDRYSGRVLDYENPPSNLSNVTPDPRGMEVFKMLIPMHFGTWTGWFSRFVYFCVGLSPTILLATSFVMWKYRNPQKRSRSVAERKSPVKF